jgi:hypothetical protein
MMRTDLTIMIKGGFHVGKDGNIHSEECCMIGSNAPWSREDKGFDRPMEFVAVGGWPLAVIPRIGEQIKLPDKPGDREQVGQEVTVQDVVYMLPRLRAGHTIVEVWVGGWVHWEAQSVRDLFDLARQWAQAVI